MTGTRSLVLVAGVLIALLAVALAMPGDTSRVLLGVIGVSSFIGGVAALRRSLDVESA